MPRRESAVNRWCATLNNYTQAEQQSLQDACAHHFKYAVIGREVGDSGTPHLQMFFITHNRLRLRQVKQLPGLQRAHLEPANGTSQQAAAYCKKEGDFDEHGELPQSGPRQDMFAAFRDWYREQPDQVTEAEILEAHPGILRYPGFVETVHRCLGKRPTLVDGDLRNWQLDLSELIDGEPDDRKICFVVDEAGNKGKSWLTRYWFSNRDDIQMLSVGKRDDLAYAIDTSKRVFVFDIPRGNMEYFQYSVVESLKNQMIMSNKYKSQTKIIPHKVHVIVFCNEEPDRNAMTRDRYQVKRITPL
ncbi:MAG: putative viral replication protein [Peronelivirus doingaes]|uniref:Putative viral replication protein n=1 Tax=Circoviridae sp. TaxID=1954248 RepID=A0A385E6F2_9VIRU|nr:MAG: putative viral replication protein [Circoviridae sp.]